MIPIIQHSVKDQSIAMIQRLIFAKRFSGSGIEGELSRSTGGVLEQQNCSVWQCSGKYKAFSSVQFIAQSCLTLYNPINHCLPGFSVHGDPPDKNTGVCYHALLQGIFWTQGSNPHVSCIGRQVLYHQRFLGSPCKQSVTLKDI